MLDQVRRLPSSLVRKFKEEVSVWSDTDGPDQPSVDVLKDGAADVVIDGSAKATERAVVVRAADPLHTVVINPAV